MGICARKWDLQKSEKGLIVGNTKTAGFGLKKTKEKVKEWKKSPKGRGKGAQKGAPSKWWAKNLNVGICARKWDLQKSEKGLYVGNTKSAVFCLKTTKEK